jgi:flagellar assembly protein FliH
MTGSLPPRIPFEQLADSKPWHLPEVKGPVINQAEQRQRQKKAEQTRVQHKAEQQSRKRPDSPPVAGEPVVAPAVKPMTAKELEAITRLAEQDGFSKGYQEGSEQGRQEGRQAGYAEGLKAGTEQAKSEQGQWYQAEAQALAGVIESLAAPRQAQQDQLAAVLLELAVAMAEALVADKLNREPHSLWPLVYCALDALPPDAVGVKVWLNANDWQALQDAVPDRLAGVSLAVDADLGRGSCRVESRDSRVDYQLASRLAAFLTELPQTQLAERPLALTPPGLPVQASAGMPPSGALAEVPACLSAKTLIDDLPITSEEASDLDANKLDANDLAPDAWQT